MMLTIDECSFSCNYGFRIGPTLQLNVGFMSRAIDCTTSQCRCLVFHKLSIMKPMFSCSGAHLSLPLHCCHVTIVYVRTHNQSKIIDGCTASRRSPSTSTRSKRQFRQALEAEDNQEQLPCTSQCTTDPHQLHRRARSKA